VTYPHKPTPIPAIHPFKTVDSARTRLVHLSNERLRITIDHDPLVGITPAMLLYWFQHIGGAMEYAGATYPRYSVWHPIDHIHWGLAKPSPGGGAAEGASFHIVEAFGGDENLLIDTIDRVEKLDETGIRLVKRVAGAKVFQLEHTWSAGRGRTHYVSVFDLGSPWRLLYPVNLYLRRRVFRPEMDQAWVKHNIEEVGLLEHILPSLMTQRDSRRDPFVGGGAVTGS